MLGETIEVIGMSTENVKIKCPAKPITYAFSTPQRQHEWNKYVRSANMQRKELKGRKNKDITGNGRRGKIPSKKIGIRQMLHPHET